MQVNQTSKTIKRFILGFVILIAFYGTVGAVYLTQDHEEVYTLSTEGF